MTAIKEEAKPNLANQEKTLADNVLNRVNMFAKSGALKLPENYSAANALKFAWLMLTQTVDKDKKPVLQTCSKESVANALLEMCIQGLNPMKKQCYFIAYGGKLEMQRSYQGSIAVAKQVGGIKSVHANVIFEGDVFEYEVNPNTGRKHVTKHEQKIENIDLNKIRGAYAVAVFADGSTNMEAMNILQIKKAWAQGKGGGNTGAHLNFTDEMCRKTVINRLCKTIINNSDDSSLFKSEEENQPEITVDATVIEEIKENANATEISIDDAPEETNQEVITEEKIEGEKPGF